MRAGCATGPAEVRLLQDKSDGGYLSVVERDQFAALAVPGNVSRGAWRFPDPFQVPLIERP
jgi:hypothetical protein